MTGAYVRIERAGRWQNVEFDELTPDEFDAFAAAQPEQRGWVWAKFLAQWIRDNVATGAPAPERSEAP